MIFGMPTLIELNGLEEQEKIRLVFDVMPGLYALDYYGFGRVFTRNHPMYFGLMLFGEWLIREKN